MNSMTVRWPNESGAVMLSVTGVRWTRVAGGGVDYTLNVFVHVGTDGLHGFFQRDWQYSRFVLGSAPRARLAVLANVLKTSDVSECALGRP